MKKCIFIFMILLLTSCSNQSNESIKDNGKESYTKTTIRQEETKKEIETKNEISIIRNEGSNIVTRFLPPEGCERVKTEKGTFQEYLRTLPLKPAGSKVHYFDGQEKSADVYDAVVDMDIGTQDLQQCADAVMRLRAEYLYTTKQYDKLHFNLTNGFRADFSKWAEGYRIAVRNNKTAWLKKTGYSDSYKSFRKYLDFVFVYAGTLSLEKELTPTTKEQMYIGDVFIKGGSPGHCVIVVDMAENKTTGEKLFMLAQSYMPAQDIQILKNKNNKDISPWYSTRFDDYLRTPEWIFPSDSLRRFK